MFVGHDYVNSLFSVSVLIGGQPQPLYRDPRENFLGGHPLLYMAGQLHREYQINVTNRKFFGELEVTCAVDKLNVERREEYQPNVTRGILVPYGGTYEIKGFRIDKKDVHPFVFDYPEDAVAVEQMGQSIWSVGAIGVMVFDGVVYRPKPVYRPVSRDYATKSGMESLTFGTDMTRSSDMGTSMSNRKEESRLSGEVRFDRNGISQALVIRYRSLGWLMDRGIWTMPTFKPDYGGNDDPFNGSGKVGGW